MRKLIRIVFNGLIYLAVLRVLWVVPNFPWFQNCSVWVWKAVVVSGGLLRLVWVFSEWDSERRRKEIGEERVVEAEKSMSGHSVQDSTLQEWRDELEDNLRRLLSARSVGK